MTENTPPKPVDASPTDMAPLIAGLREWLLQHKGDSVSRGSVPPGELVKRFGFAEEGKGRPEVILSEDVFVELGHPSQASLAVILTTFDPSLVENGRVTVVGPDVSAMRQDERPSFAQVIVVAVDPLNIPDPFSLENAQYLMHRLPGYMVRSVPGRLWVRMSKKGRAAGLDLFSVGSAMNASLARDFPGVLAVETIFVTRSREAVEELGPISVESKIFSGQHKKLVLGLDGTVECTELNCETCEEKPVCDTLRDVVIARRESKR